MVLPFNLDLLTMAVADTFVTALLGFVLVFAWLQSRASYALGWWGSAHLCQCAGLTLLVLAEASRSLGVLKLGTTLLLTSYALMWIGARRFENRTIAPLLMFSGVLLWMLAIFSDLTRSSAHYLMLYSAINAAYCFAIAFEFWRGRAEPLVSRWPAIVLLATSGAGFLSWIPLTGLLPQATSALVFPGPWFAVVILATILGKVALAFIVLAMAKERLELRQFAEAQTDPLTGLPNRRGFFRQALRRMRQRKDVTGSMSVILFDLDHFKSVNDRFGHGVGDRVLQSFAETLSVWMKATDVIGRVGGEEFAALLPDTDATAASVVAERVRAAFEAEAFDVEGTPFTATVSAGVVGTNSDDCSLHVLIGHADVALYEAKESGRNRVKIVDIRTDGENEGRLRIPVVEAPRTRPSLTVVDGLEKGRSARATART
jgi:diguanylate cyclase (GGDEF)-like protein